MDVDEAYKHVVGEFGPFQRQISFGVCLLNVLIALHTVQNIIVGAEPEFFCVKDGSSTPGCPSQDGDVCDSYEFPLKDFSSVVSEYRLVCGQSYKVDLIQSYVMAGILCGNLVFGIIGDRYGRHKGIYLGTLGIALTTVCGIFAPSFYFYAATRLIAGFFCGGTMLLSFVLMTEILGASKRGIAGVAVSIFFALGIALLGALGYYIRDWKTLSLVTALPTVLAFYFWWVVPESPRWLYSQGRMADAERLLDFIAYKNTGKNPEKAIELRQQEKSSTAEPQPSMLELVKNATLRSRTLNNLFTWFVNCVVYYGLTMGAGNLGSGLYISVILSGLVEMPGYLIAYFLMDRIGRRLTYSGSMLMGGSMCLSLMVVSEGQPTLRLALAVLGKMCIAMSFSVAWLYAAELYPTSIRNKAISLCSMVARVGGIISPLILTMGKYHKNMDFIIFGVLAIVAAAVCLRLPETLNCPMPETIADLEKPSGGDSRSSAKSPPLAVKVTLSDDKAMEEKLKLLEQEIDNSNA